MSHYLTPELLSVLVCPKDQGTLHYEKEKHQLVCDTCKHAYPIKNGVPNMLG